MFARTHQDDLVIINGVIFENLFITRSRTKLDFLTFVILISRTMLNKYLFHEK